jgi:hypothetical protein
LNAGSGTHTEATEAKTGLVQVTSARSEVMETGRGVSVWNMPREY